MKQKILNILEMTGEIVTLLLIFITIPVLITLFF